MNRRTTIALLLVAVLLAAFLALTRSETLSIGGQEETEETPSAPQALFEEAQSDLVIAFSITDNQTGDRFAAEVEGESAAWTITESPVEPEAEQVVDVATLDFAAASLTTLVVSRELDEFENLTEYGLETARYTLTFHTLGGGQFTLDIGDRTPTGGSYYVQRQGDEGVKLVTSATLDAFVGFLSEPPYAEPTPTPPPTPAS